MGGITGGDLFDDEGRKPAVGTWDVVDGGGGIGTDDPDDGSDARI